MKKRIWVVIALATAAVTAAFWKLGAPELDRMTVYRKAARDRLLTLDPSQCRFRANSQVVRAIFGQMVELDAAGRVMPGHFQSWTTPDEGRTYQFELRPALKFSDGTDVVPEDALASLSYLARSDSSVRHVFDELVGIEAARANGSYPVGLRLERGTIVVELNAPNMRFPSLLADSRIGLFPARALIEGASFFERPIGAGTYRVESWEPKTGDIVLVRNSHAPAPKTAMSSFRIIAVESSERAKALFEERKLDDLEGFDFDPGTIARDDVRFFPTSIRTTSLFFHPKKFANIEDRFAFAKILDRDALRKSCFPHLTIAKSVLPEGVMGGGNDVMAELASKLPSLESALVRAKDFGSFRFSQLEDGADECTARYVTELAQQHQLPWTYETVPTSQAKTRLEGGDYEMFTEFLTIRDAEPISMLSLAYGKSAINLTGEVDPEFDAIYEKALAASSRPEKVGYYEKLDRLLIGKARSFPLFTHQVKAVFDRRVSAAVSPTILYGMTKFEDIWLEP